MEFNSDFLKISVRSMIRYSLAQLVYIYNDDSKFHKLERLNNTIAGKIARNILEANSIIILKSNFSLDKFAKLNFEKRPEIEVRGIDGYIDDNLIKAMDSKIEEFNIDYLE